MDDQGHGGYRGEEDFYNSNPTKLQPGKPFWQRHLWKIIIGIAVVLLLIVASAFALLRPSPGTAHTTQPGPVSSAVPTQIPATATPTPTVIAGVTATPTIDPSATITPTTAPGQTDSTLPCVVNISTWSGGSQDWTVHNGILYNDGTNNNTQTGPTLIAPCVPVTPSYRVEAKIQVTNPSSYGCFGIVFRGSSSQNGWQGYKGDICNNTASISAYGDNDALTQAPFTPGTSMHTYRIDVHDNSIKLFIDGNLVDNATDNRLLTSETGEGVGLYSQNVQIQVNSFQVTALS